MTDFDIRLVFALARGMTGPNALAILRRNFRDRFDLMVRPEYIRGCWTLGPRLMAEFAAMPYPYRSTPYRQETDQ